MRLFNAIWPKGIRSSMALKLSTVNGFGSQFGGSPNAACSSVKLSTISHTNGASIRAPTMKRISPISHRRAVMPPPRKVRSCPVHPSPRTPELQQGHQHRHREHQQRDGRGVTDPEVLETLLVQVHHDADRRVVRPALRGDDLDRVEDLERADERDHGGEEDR